MVKHLCSFLRFSKVSFAVYSSTFLFEENHRTSSYTSYEKGNDFRLSGPIKLDG